MKKSWKITLSVASAITVIAVGLTVANLTSPSFPSKPNNTTPNGTIDVTKHGVVANDRNSADENTKKINRIIRNAKKGDTIVFPKGDYYVASTQTSGGLTVYKKSDITIKGTDACIINTSFSPYYAAQPTHYMDSNIFVIRNSDSITLEGISVDYDQHTNISGVVVETADGQLALKAYKEYISGDNAVKGEEYITSVCIFGEDGNPTNEVYLSETKLLQAIDAKNGIFALPTDICKAGQQVCIRFSNGSYSCPAISMSNVNGFTARKVWVRSCPSASVYVMEDNENFTFDGFKVAPEEDSKNIYASNEDCIHIKGLRGDLKLYDCEFEGIGDDALNIHSLAALVEERNDNTVKIVNGRTHEKFNNWASVGDTIEVYDDGLALLGFAKVVKVKGNSIELDSVPSGTTANAILHNSSRSPNVTVDNCTVKRGRARGFLIQAKKATITNCTFESLGLSGVLIAPDISNWYEMGPCEEATLTGNTFRHCCTRVDSEYGGAVTVALNHDLAAATSNSKPHGTITVTGNKFENCCTNAVFIQGAKTAKVTDNDFGTHKVQIK